MSNKTPRLIVVELADDTEFDAQFVAGNIVAAFKDRVKSAYPALDNGFGYIVKSGESVDNLPPFGSDPSGFTRV